MTKVMAGAITISLPASVAGEVPVMAQRLVDRMHDLLERNTDGKLGSLEQEELSTLVDMAEFAQMFATALRQAEP